MLRYLLVLFIITVSIKANAQQPVLYWFALQREQKAGKELNLLFDASHRFTLNDKWNSRVTALQLTASRQLRNKALSIGAGYGFFWQHETKDIYEHRLWQQLTHRYSTTKQQIDNRLRFEERYRYWSANAKDKLTGLRLRYQVMYRRQIIPKKLNAVLGNELMFQYFKTYDKNLFDQDRLMLGLHIPVNRSAVTLLYQYTWQHRQAIHKLSQQSSVRCIVRL